MEKPRRYISVYFSDGLVHERKRGDVTIAFSETDDLYEKCRHLSSSEIKRIIGLDSYRELVNKANEDGRSINNYIKQQLRISLNEKKNTSC